MTDEAIVTSEAGDPASAPSAPAAPVLDADAIKAQLLTELQPDFDKRAAGFQRALNEKESALRVAQDRARELEQSGLTQEERDAQEWQSMQEKVQKLEAENLLLAKQGEFPDEVAVLRQLQAATDYDQQLTLLRALRQQRAEAAAQAQTPAAEPETDIPPIDPNNPLSRPEYGTDTIMLNGQPMTAQMSEQILSQFRGPTR